MQAVAAPAGNGIVKRKLQIVVAQKPVESRPRFGSPAAVSGDAVGLQSGRDRTRSLNRLLIEAGLFTILTVETLRPDGHKRAVGRAALHFGEPVQSFECGGNHTLIRATRPHQTK